MESPRPQRIPYWRIMVDQGVVTPEIIEYPYAGKGTEDEPYIVEWIPDDPRNPMLFSSTVKWTYTIIVAFSTFAVSLCSSAYAGTIQEVIESFGIVQEVATLGVALFVLGFAVGPLIWAPLSELVGRQIVFFFTFFALAAFSAGGAGAQNPWSLIILRFFAGSFGSSPLTNAGGVVADTFNADKRGLAMSLFAGAPFLGVYFLLLPRAPRKKKADHPQGQPWDQWSVASLAKALASDGCKDSWPFSAVLFG